jgi:dTDP-4-amino-4,6-dideoxygalactose transaminase
MMMKKINGYKLVFNKDLKNKINNDLKQIIDSGNLSNGKYVRRFEEKFKRLHGSKFAVACNSGGGALEILFKSLDIEGKEVLVPTNTFIATYNAIKFAGGIPKLIDTAPDSLNISLETVKKAVTKKTKCITIVHIGAIISDEIIKIAEFCKKKKIYLVEDCAHSVLTKSKGIFAGNFGIAGAFSFFATKSITSGEGGMVTTNNFNLYKKLKLHVSYGMSKSYNDYDYKLFGANFRMNELEAVVGYHHLINYGPYLKKKIKIKKIYDLILKNKIQIFKSKSLGNLYKYICILPKNRNKKDLVSYFNRNNISLSGDVYNKPLHKFKIIKNINKEKLPNAEKICARHFCLPIYYGLKLKDANYVARKLLEFLN